MALVWYGTHVSRKAMAEALREHADDLPPEITGDEDVVSLLGGSEPMSGMNDDPFSARIDGGWYSKNSSNIMSSRVELTPLVESHSNGDDFSGKRRGGSNVSKLPQVDEHDVASHAGTSNHPRSRVGSPRSR